MVHPSFLFPNNTGGVNVVILVPKSVITDAGNCLGSGTGCVCVGGGGGNNSFIFFQFCLLCEGNGWETSAWDRFEKKGGYGGQKKGAIFYVEFYWSGR